MVRCIKKSNSDTFLILLWYFFDTFWYFFQFLIKNKNKIIFYVASWREQNWYFFFLPNWGKMRENEGKWGKKVSIFGTENRFLIGFFLKIKFMVRIPFTFFFSFLKLFFHFFDFVPLLAWGAGIAKFENISEKIDFFFISFISSF